MLGGQVSRQRDEGTVTVVFSMMLTVIIGMLALVVDVGLVLSGQVQLQNAADAASLAATQELLSGGDPHGVAITYATANAPDHGVVTDAADVTIGRWDLGAGVFVPSGVPNNAVRVATRRLDSRGNSVDLLFGPVIARTTAEIHREAVAALVPATSGDVVPVSLRSPGFGPVDPEIVIESPGKAGPSLPATGTSFVPGEEVILFTFGKGKQSPVHLVLETPGDPSKTLSGEESPVLVEIGDELFVVGEGTGQGGLGGDLAERLDHPPGHPARHILVPVVEEKPGSRNAEGELAGRVRIGALVGVRVDRVQEMSIPDPEEPGDFIDIEVVIGIVEAVLAGGGGGQPSSGVGGQTVTNLRLVA